MFNFIFDPLKNFHLRCTQLLITLFLSSQALQTNAQHSSVIAIKDTRFSLDEKPFEFFGISFFNALYNPAFNKSEADQLQWLQKFKNTGITVLRIWAEWNSSLGFVDVADSCILYNRDGSLKPLYLSRLKRLLEATASQNMVVEIALFSAESKDIKLSDASADKAVENITKALKPYRNITFQIWNELDYRTLDYYRIIKQHDPARLVSNSPGGGGTLGNDKENSVLDYLSPHTSRHGKHWEEAVEEIRGLMAKFKKPVVDDEPARNGTPKFGGPKDGSHPFDHILHIYNVSKVGGYSIYHHDMFQTGKGSPAVPPSGIPDPDFSEYHKAVFEFIKVHKKYSQPEAVTK
jgi:hypothetical protein